MRGIIAVETAKSIGFWRNIDKRGSFSLGETGVADPQNELADSQSEFRGPEDEFSDSEIGFPSPA
jgi:hypothetical protein